MKLPNSREAIVFWGISFAFGAGMLALLIAMCAAEVSIHRNRPSPAVLSGEIGSIGDR